MHSKRPCSWALSVNFSKSPFPDSKVLSSCLLEDCRFIPFLKKSHNNEMKTTWPNSYMWVQIYSYCMAYGLNVLLECLLNYPLSIQWCLEITFPENQLAWGKNNWNQITSCFGNLDEEWNHQHIARNSLTHSSEQRRD